MGMNTLCHWTRNTGLRSAKGCVQQPFRLCLIIYILVLLLFSYSVRVDLDVSADALAGYCAEDHQSLNLARAFDDGVGLLHPDGDE
jgi:hypothetical protein